MTYVKLRQQVLERDNYTCQNCDSIERLDIHHLIPIMNGGEDLLEDNQLISGKLIVKNQVDGHTAPDGRRWGPLQNICKSCHNIFHRHGTNVKDAIQYEMNDILEILHIAKLRNGMLEKREDFQRTILDENDMITFGYVNSTNQITEITIPLGRIGISKVIDIKNLL